MQTETSWQFVRDCRTALVYQERGKTYESLDLAWRCLQKSPEDVTVRHAVLNGCAKLGLPDLALEVARGFPDELLKHPDFSKAINDLRKMPSARVPWSTCHSQFKSNLSVLLERFSWARDLEKQWYAGGPRTLQLYRCSDGNYEICQRDERGIPVWWSGFTDHKAIAEFIIGRVGMLMKRTLMKPPFLLEGLPSYHLLNGILRLTDSAPPAYTPLTYVVEPELIWLAAALHLHDWSGLLTQSRLLLFVGPNAVHEYQDYLLNHDQAPQPQDRVRPLHCRENLHDNATEAMKHVSLKRKQEVEFLEAQVHQIYDSRGPRCLAEKFSQTDGKNLPRVMLRAPRFTRVVRNVMRDLAEAFRAMGYPTELLTEEHDHAAFSAISYHKRILDFQPDLFINPNETRERYKDVLPPQVVVATWVQDPVDDLLTPSAAQEVQTVCSEPDDPTLAAPTDYVFGYYRNDFVHKYGYPPERCLFYPIVPSNPHLFHPVEVTPAMLARYGCEVAFLSHGGESCEKGLAKLLETFEPPTRPVVEALFETIRDRYRAGGELLCYAGSGPHSQLRRLAESLAIERSVDPALLGDFDRRFNLLNDRIWRYTTIEWLMKMDVDFRLYGQGWERHPLFSRIAHPAVSDPEEISAVCNCAKVNLQIGAYGAMHQRMITGLFAGGFFLTRESSYNYGVFDDLHPETQTSPHTPDQRRGALSALMDLSRQGCDSPDRFHHPDNAPLLERLCPILRETLPPSEQNDPSSLWEAAQLMMRIIPAAVFPDCWFEVSFWTRDEMADRIHRFLHREPQRRAELAAYMRQRCLAGHGPEPLIHQLIGHISRQLTKAVADRSPQ